MKMRKNIVSVLAMLLVLLLTVGSFGAAFAETAATTKPLSELTQEDIDYLRSLLVTEDGPLMGEELLAHINSFTGEELYWTLAAVSDEQYASLQEILTEEELIALFAPLNEGIVNVRRYTNVADFMEFESPVMMTYALRSAAKPNQSETKGLYLNKSAVFDAANYKGTITMEAYVEGAVKTETSSTKKPCDIVLVLDESGSMGFGFTKIYESDLDTSKTYYLLGDAWDTTKEVKYSNGKWRYNGQTVTPKTNANDQSYNHVQFYSDTRMQGLKEAANGFIDSVAANTTSEYDNRIAIVTFDSNLGTPVGTLTNASTGKTTLKNAVNNLSAGGATQADLGMEEAKDIIAAAYSADNADRKLDRNRVVVLFTDGTPTSGSSFEPDVANDAIEDAYTMKNSYATTVYSIGIFDGADPSNDTTNENKYMHRVSSNSMNATKYTNGTLTQTGYYLVGEDTDDLIEIFGKISSNTSGSASIELTETTVITDTISPTFELPTGTDADDIKVYTADSNEDGTWDTPVPFDATVTVDSETQTVTVTGFDFQANYVGEHAADGVSTGWAGKKLIIEIPFEPTDDYFGGNELATNTTAKIENAESKFSEEFGAPTVDVPLRYEIAAQDQAIYLSNTADLSTIMQYVTNAPSTYACDNGSVDYKPNGTNNADVNIVYTLKDSAKNTVATLTIPRGTAASDCSWVWADGVDDTPVLTADEKYTVSCTVTPVTTRTYSAIEKTAEGNVYVYKPQVTANDKTVDYGAVVTLKDQVVGEVEWTHPKHATIGNLLDPTKKPSTVLTFKVNDVVATTATVTVTAETPVEITLGLNDPQATFDFMPYTTFVRNATPCDFETCDAKDETSHIGTAEACEFKLHLGTISGVKVKKVVTGNMANRNQEFEFTATYADQTVNFRLAHDGEHELKNLPIGTTLTITEVQTGYTTTVTADGATKDGLAYTDMIAADDAGKTITFNNHKEAEIDTGISLDSLPYILLLAVVAAGVVFFVVRRKRSED